MNRYNQPPDRATDARMAPMTLRTSIRDSAAGHGRHIWGVIGGMGPLASVEFLKTIYEMSLTGPEQNSPSLFLISDPTFPDRTDCLLAGRRNELVVRLLRSLEQLSVLGATRIVICCVTIHEVLADLPEHHLKKIVSLVELILSRVAASKKRSLLLCSNGSRRTGLFESNALWEKAKPYMVLPNASDQDRIHGVIYEVKQNRIAEINLQLIRDLVKKYRVKAIVAGCTEMHVLGRILKSIDGDTFARSWVDPLVMVAQQIAENGQLKASIKINSRHDKVTTQR
jgi:aspartate racemase